MRLRLARWSPRRVGALWGAGLLLEAALLLAMFAVLVPPTPPLVARLRGEHSGAGAVAIVIFRPGDPRPVVPPAAAEDSFYTVVHWPPTRPLLAGGGHVVAVPMRFWWVPALYVGAVPVLLAGLTGAWLWARRPASGREPPS